MGESAQSLERALTQARGTCIVPNCGYDKYCPYYWKRVFVLYYDDMPEGNSDPRWNRLFSEGFPLQNRLWKDDPHGTAAS